MKRRVNIAAALVHNPKIVIMDEPTVGIDPQNRDDIWNIILSLKESGKSIILTSHYVDEIERLSDRVLIVDNGRVITQGTVRELTKEYCKTQTCIVEFFNLNNQIIESIKKLPIIKSVTVKDNKLFLMSDNNTSLIEELIKHSSEENMQIKNIDFKKPNLEEVFFHFTGRGLRE